MTAAADPSGTGTEPRPVGRPRQFDPDAALAAIVVRFWDQGYERTSMADLEDATGLARSSLYHHWGGKDALFAAALEAYQQLLWTTMLAPLAEGDAGIDDIHTFLGRLAANDEPDRPQGCLMASSIAERGRDDPAVVCATDEYRSRLTDALRAALRRAAGRCEVNADAVDSRARLLATWVIGASISARSLPDQNAAHTEVDAARALVESWRR